MTNDPLMRLLYLSSIFPHGTARVTGTFNLELCRALAAEHDVRVVTSRSFLDVWRTRAEMPCTRHDTRCFDLSRRKRSWMM